MNQEYIFAVGLHAKDQPRVVGNSDGTSNIVALCRDETQARIIAASYNLSDAITYWPVSAETEKVGNRLSIVIADTNDDLEVT